MTSPLDFDGLGYLLGNWPGEAVPEAGSDGIFGRICQILRSSQRSGTVPRDIIPLLRHVLRRQSLQRGIEARLRVPADNGWPSQADWSAAGMRAPRVGTGQFLIDAVPWTPEWMDAAQTPLFEDAYAERKVRIDWRCPMDPFLEAASRFDHYVSPGQREAIRSALLLPPAATLIVSLPTGSGKSLVAQAPVLTRGLESGLTLCVVPTTALALDQARQMENLLRVRFPTSELTSLAWHSGLRRDQRQAIKTAIRRSRQGILYCSPEAVAGALLPALYDAARLGFLSYLVIDEAHLVSQWGDGFRPDFQMLAGVRRGLLEACAGPAFRTILMSATLTPETIETIDTLFGPPKSAQMIASIYLRPEPQYWVHREPDQDIKVERVLDAIRHAPRPLILYVTRRDDARAWFARLRKEGFLRCACFHGETNDIDRRHIIDLWSEDGLDVIVATSAFGVGIDKQDVRAVIHATVPETADRFYQEVGRGGRDGRVSASLMIYSDFDLQIADRLSAPGLISDDLAFERWSTMFDNAKHLDAMGGLLEVDLDVVPPKLKQQTDYNAAWNMRTLVMMARAKMLQLESRPPDAIARNEDEGEADFELRSERHWSHYFSRAVVNIFETGHRNSVTFAARFGGERSRSAVDASKNRALLDRLVAGNVEFSGLLDDLYRSHAPRRTLIVSKACGGCPAHRREGTTHLDYSEPFAHGIEDVTIHDVSLFKASFPHLDLTAPVIFPLPELYSSQIITEILGDLIATFGIREVAVSNEFRSLTPELRRLHRRADDGILLLQSIEEDAIRLPSYKLPRASVLPPDGAPHQIFLLNRPLHLLLVPQSTPDPTYPGRRLTDTGTNVLTMDQFQARARA